jgi:class 3 adenylate cyclase
MPLVKSSQRQLALFLLLQVAFFLAGIGLLGYFFIRGHFLTVWQDAAIFRLEQAAKDLDLEMDAPVKLISSFAKTESAGTQKYLQEQLALLEVVNRVKLTWLQKSSRKVTAVSPPQYFYPEDRKEVGLRSQLLDKAGHPLGTLEVWLDFDYLVEGILTTAWMQNNMACLVNETGQFLALSNPAMQIRKNLGETQDPLEGAMKEALQEKPYGTLTGKGYFPGKVIAFYRLQTAPWTIMVHGQGSQILAPINYFRTYYLAAALLCLVLILVIIRAGVAPLMSGIRNLSQKVAQVAQGDYGNPLPETGDEIGKLSKAFNYLVSRLKEQDFIRKTFGGYVDREIARELLSQPDGVPVRGEKREVVILFADIRDFTGLTEPLSPEATILLLNRFFSLMMKLIQQHRGIIVDFPGDAILTFFDPLNGPLAPVVRRALECALKMQKAMEKLNLPDQEPSMPHLQIGIGVHVGEVVVGNVGSEILAKYGIVGSAVSLTHRIQALARGGEVLISGAVYREVESEVVVQKEFQTHLKGIPDHASLYVFEGFES